MLRLSWLTRLRQRRTFSPLLKLWLGLVIGLPSGYLALGQQPAAPWHSPFPPAQPNASPQSATSPSPNVSPQPTPFVTPKLTVQSPTNSATPSASQMPSPPVGLQTP